ncbi:RHS repeat-associated core domain-containing protein [Pseudomonas syringae]|uniref:RHS repeat-associated core domain-containing protein n=1 Tax=Pseudomonas TaxID=286 RepID=UPI000CD1FCD5|nr:RHS repeat-associated core domain-containing protein [Pseudomonas syringae]MCF5028820.1 RHS repeat-associated core domain-containing protein [Pseudomonas syringae]POD21358.1 RHS family protein [Pseudomonas syringae pv. syringae]UQB20542.1 RHS repeat-associated core domain-containing protein [Pseudomonas syringae pv. syringae]
MAILCRYTYDPLDRVSTLTPLAQAVFNRFYNGEQLMTELQGGRQRTCVRAGGQLLAQQLREGDEVVTTMIAGDRNNSVLHASGAMQQADIAYSPYGHRDAVRPVAELPGFNGEQPDPLTGHYLLGNGYRAYNPVLMRFNSPDSMSPFGKGGLNAYAYCVGDPVNRVDPTGHFSALAALISGIVLSAAGAGAIATAAGLKDSDSTLGTTLTVVGSISLMAGLGAFATTGFKLKQTSVKLKQMRAKIKTGKREASDLASARKKSSARHAEALTRHADELQGPPASSDSALTFRLELMEADVMKNGPYDYYSSSFLDPVMLNKIRDKDAKRVVVLDSTSRPPGLLTLTRIDDGQTLRTKAHAIREIT